ncbi:hypothetical protein [Neobacillus niacini]|nr:hypothetical protein [Neobacillus niacini]
MCDLEFEEVITVAKDDSNVGTAVTIGEPTTLGYPSYESAL